jgi:hypothetical protein
VSRNEIAAERRSRELRAAQNQSLFRQVNERIEDLNDSFNVLLPVGDWVCECADESCFQRMAMTVAEYEAVRAHPARFPVLPGHELLDVEAVVERHEGYVVVEKLGAGGTFAAEVDPRSSGTVRIPSEGGCDCGR